MMCIGDLDPKHRTLSGNYVSQKLTYMQLKLQNCVEPKSGVKPQEKYCKSSQEVKEFFKTNYETRVLFTEDRFAISNSTHPLVSHLNSDLSLYTDLAYTSVLNLFL